MPTDRKAGAGCAGLFLMDSHSIKLEKGCPPALQVRTHLRLSSGLIVQGHTYTDSKNDTRIVRQSILTDRVAITLKISDFQTKDVINIIDGKKLGQISDLELDLKQGRVDAIVVPNYSKFLGIFGGGTELVIPWRNIVKIGEDVVLVKMEEPRPPRLEEPEAALTTYRP